MEGGDTRPVGRPLKFQSVEELQQQIDAYFDSCWDAEEGYYKRPYTVTGLALALDTSRKVLLDYQNRNDEYSDAIKRAKNRVENYAEEALFTSKQTAGIIFNLKNNHGWVDKTEQDVNANVNVNKLEDLMS